MPPVPTRPPLLFKRSSGDPGGDGAGPRSQEETAARDPDAAEPIRCRSCRRVITHLHEGIRIQGAHAHTFANPHGIVFRIGCFRSAPGCGYLGSPTAEFTWFTGFTWRAALCARCRVNVGWLFASPGGERFHGLILERLIFPGR